MYSMQQIWIPNFFVVLKTRVSLSLFKDYPLKAFVPSWPGLVVQRLDRRSAYNPVFTLDKYHQNLLSCPIDSAVQRANHFPLNKHYVLSSTQRVSTICTIAALRQLPVCHNFANPRNCFL